MLELIEETIINQLKSSELFKGFDIDREPENFANYDFLSEFGCLLISFDGITYTNPQTLSNITQTATYQFNIVIGQRYFPTGTLKDSYEFLSEIHRVMTGARVNDGKFYPIELKYLGKLDRTHYYNYKFNIKVTTSSVPEIDNVVKLFDGEI